MARRRVGRDDPGRQPAARPRDGRRRDVRRRRRRRGGSCGRFGVALVGGGPHQGARAGDVPAARADGARSRGAVVARVTRERQDDRRGACRRPEGDRAGRVRRLAAQHGRRSEARGEPGRRLRGQPRAHRGVRRDHPLQLPRDGAAVGSSRWRSRQAIRSSSSRPSRSPTAPCGSRRC